MTLSAGTQEAVQALWTIGARYGREVRPNVGADLLEDDDPLNPQDASTVELIGVPDITVRLFRDLSDIVIIDSTIEFEVPRNDTLAVVEVVLSGNARLRRDGSTRWSAVRTLFLAPFVPYAALVGYALVVTVPGGACCEHQSRSDPWAAASGCRSSPRRSPPGAQRPSVGHVARRPAGGPLSCRPLPVLVQSSSSA